MDSSFPFGPLRPTAALVVFAATALAATPAWSVDPFEIEDIRVEGLQRTDPGTVFAALPFRLGDTYTDEKAAAALRSLFATGLFSDVRIVIEGRTAVVIVDERPIVAKVDFVGLKEFEKDVLVSSLKACRSTRRSSTGPSSITSDSIWRAACTAPRW
jgi:outer membrane protein insertion porin family